MSTRSSQPVPPLAVVGQGRMGTALSRALRNAGFRVSGPLGRGASTGDARVVILCVPDAQIAAAAAACAADAILGHCSGATTLAPLAPHEAFSMHPLLTVTIDTESFAGAGCAVHANSARAEALCDAIVDALGMQPFEVADELRALYHAAASAASNYIVTVATLAEELAARANVDRALLAPLARAAVDNWARDGRQALTGPIARGDEQTVMKQRAAVASHASETLPLWDALVDGTRAIARENAPAPGTAGPDEVQR